jgi:hypothetical protein
MALAKSDFITFLIALMFLFSRPFYLQFDAYTIHDKSANLKVLFKKITLNLLYLYEPIYLEALY